MLKVALETGDTGPWLTCTVYGTALWMTVAWRGAGETALKLGLPGNTPWMKILGDSDMGPTVGVCRSCVVPSEKEGVVSPILCNFYRATARHTHGLPIDICLSVCQTHG